MTENTGRNARPVPLDEAHTVVEHWICHPGIVMLDTAVKTVGGRETGQQAIVVGVVEKKSADSLTARDFLVPPTVDVDVVHPDGSVRRRTLPTDVIETGPIRPMTQPYDPMNKLHWYRRPCMGGYEISPLENGIHPRSGTLGVMTVYRRKRCLLTNSHVISSRSNAPGLDVYQPLRFHGFKKKDGLIGNCKGCIDVISYPWHSFFWALGPIRNVFDFAWCEIPPRSKDVNFGIYRISETMPNKPLPIRREPVVDEEVRWIGMTTGRPQWSTIQSVHTQLATEGADWTRTAYWRDVIRIRTNEHAYIRGGDSGSAMIGNDGAILGLMTFGGDKWPLPRDIYATRIPPDDYQRDDANGYPQELRLAPHPE
ncbi:hypothetical protein [Streptomyces sp. NPDC001930]|uniref:hypothetical protein n=1 Tax=Streptomyces sp. NPDC001930 TaxID=3364625 RepID=UPI0036CD88B0